MTDVSGDFEALLVLSFGGPEGPDDVIPFLENVTRGRGVPPERLAEVAGHYGHFGGISPINARNRELVAAVSELTELPVYFGNRNWHPLVEDTVAEMALHGVRRALVFATSAFGGYSACRQYHEDIARARAVVGQAAPELVKLRHFFDHPEFVAAVADGVRAARAELGAAGDKARLVFTAHSVPTAADAAAGTASDGGRWYSRQVREAARLVARQVGVPEYDVVWQSRSGPPSVPWLAPDVCDHLDVVHAAGAMAVLVCPVGFVSDHLEVVWDLDSEARARAAELGLGFARAATAGTHPGFARMVVELVAEHTSGTPPRALGAVPSAGCGMNGVPCAPDCCRSVRPTRLNR
ncbi:MAG: ferrochelatase [Pseudonocardiales bacterium]|nr:ferrochelatase [Pseudonocardiales bacterium]